MRNAGAAATDTTRRKGSAAAARLSTKHRVVFSNRYLPRVFVYRFSRLCVYSRTHAHASHARRGAFFSHPPPSRHQTRRPPACIRVHVRPDARLLVQHEGVVYLCVVGAVQPWGASDDRRVRAVWVYTGLMPSGCYIF